MGNLANATDYAPGFAKPTCQNIESVLKGKAYNRKSFQPQPIRCPRIPNNMRPTAMYMDINKNGWTGKRDASGGYAKGGAAGQYADICFRINGKSEPLCFSAAVSTGIEKSIPVTIGAHTRMVDKIPTPSQLGVYIGKIDTKYKSRSFGGSPMPYSDFFRFNFSGAPQGIAAHFRKGHKGKPASGGCIGLDWLEAETLHCMIKSMRDHGEDTAVVNIVNDARELYWKKNPQNKPRYSKLKLTDVPWYKGCYHEELRLADEARRRKDFQYRHKTAEDRSWAQNAFDGEN